MDSTMYSTLQTSSIAMIAAVCTVVPFLIYLIYRFSIKEKSFEEVLEEQKRRSIEEEMRQKAEKTKKEKKFKRSWTKKKEKPDSETAQEVRVPEEKNEIPHIEIIEPKEAKSQRQKNKKVSSVASQATEAATVAEKTKKAEATNVSNKHAQEKKKESSHAEEKESEVVKVSAKPVEVKAKVEVTQEKTSSSNLPVPAVSIPVNNVSKKKKREHVEKVIDVMPLTASKLLSLIKEAALDTEEIQNVIDILLNKQKDSTGWTKPNDQLADTKRNLLEKEQKLELEQRQNQAVVSKLKDLRDEYNTLKTKYSQLEKNSQEKIQKQQQDIQGFTSRLKQLQEQCTVEKDKCAQIEKQIEQKVATSLKSVEDENVKLQQKLSKLEVESQSGVSQAELDAVKKSREDLQKVHALLIEQHTQLVASHKTELKNLNTQLVDIKKQFEEVSAKNVVLLNDVQSLKDDKAALELPKKTLEEKLLNEEKRSADLEVQVKQLSAKIVTLNQLQSDVKNLQLENERLTEQLVSTKERVAGDGQEIVHQNGELNGKVQDEASLKSLDDKEKLLKEKETLLIQLNEDLAKLKAKITLLDEETELQKKKNNELREKNWKAVDALKQAEENAEHKVKEIQTVSDTKLSQVQKEYEEKLRIANSSQSKISSDLSERITKAESDSTKRLSDYNSEVEKNKQLTSDVERISAQQKSTESRLAQMEKTVGDLNIQIKECQNRTRECLQRIHPEVSIDNSLPHDKWLAEFENLVALAAQTSSSSISEIELTRLKSLLAEKEKELTEKDIHFRKLLSETEATLHSLQVSAEKSEAEWKQRLSEKESQLQQLLSEKDSLSAQKEEIQSTFQQIGQLEELQDKLNELQGTLESAENERSHTEQKYEEVNKNCINLRDQLENKEKQLQELQKEKNSVDHMTQEIEELKSKLEKEKKISKDFSSQMIRLNSLVKIGQDSLSAEQEMVKKLKRDLEATQVAATNGGTTAALSAPVKTESQPKSKSSEKSKKKMDASAKK